MPMLLPSATGLANTGKLSDSSATCAARSTTANAGVGTPTAATSRLAMALSSVSARVSGSLWV